MGGLYNSLDILAMNSCGEWQGVDWRVIAQANPFCDPAIYGPEGQICISPDPAKITVPFLDIMGVEGTIYTLGSSEAYILAASKDKKLVVTSEPGTHFQCYAREFLKRDIDFFDYWLKGIDNGIMDQPPVKVMIRTGLGGYYWQDENEWPIARTRYEKYYLDAAAGEIREHGKSKELLRLSKTVPPETRSCSYSGDEEWSAEKDLTYGVSFVTEPFSEDTVLAGYSKLVTWVSSTSYDMELHAALRVLDENGQEVPYPICTRPNKTATRYFPIGFGQLKVSHRKLDPVRTTEYRPYHTHTREDHQPLKPGEVVECEVEIWPTTALIRKGYRLKLDVQPATGNDLTKQIWDVVDRNYQKGAQYAVHTGADYPSYLQIPVIPVKEK
jgi:putative CocE/NonD family hydrolase